MRVLPIAAMLMLLAPGWALLASATHEPGHQIGQLGDVHWHAKFALTINGDKFDFSRDKYQVVAREVHFEQNDGDTIHVHASGMTLGHVFKTLKFQLTADCLTLDSGERYCNGEGNELAFTANGQRVQDPAAYVIRDGDVLSLAYTGDVLAAPVKPVESGLRWPLVGLGLLLALAGAAGLAKSRHKAQHLTRAQRRHGKHGKTPGKTSPVALAVLPLGGLLLLGGLVFMAPAAAQAEAGDFALLDYIAHTPDGQVLDASAPGIAGLSPTSPFDDRFKPVPFYVGTQLPPRPPTGWGAAQRMPQKLFETVVGMREGDVRSTSPVEDPYGPVDPTLVNTLNRTELIPRVMTLARSDVRGDVREGGLVEAKARAGITFPGTVLNLTGTRATVRLDPPNGTNLPIAPWPVRVEVRQEEIALVHDPQPGRHREGTRDFRVIEVNEHTFTVDANHPLTGKTVVFRVQLQQLARPHSTGGERVPDFTLRDIDGDTYQFASFRGKPVLLFTMATWCTPCIREMPELVRVRERYGDNITMINLAIDPTETDQQLRAWRDQFGADWIFAFDRENQATRALNIRALSVAHVINANGEKVWSGADPPASKLIEVIENARA